MRKIMFVLALSIFVLIAAACGNTEVQPAPSEDPQTGAIEQETNSTTSPSEKDVLKYVFTGNEGGSITKINAEDNTVVDSINVHGAVHNVQVSPDGKVLGATLVPKMETHNEDGADDHGESESMEMNGIALFYDTETNRLIKEVQVGNHPAHIVFTNDGKYVLVSNNEDNTVTVIDALNYEVKQTIPTGNQPHGFRVAADGKTAYVANMGEDTVSVLDLGSMQEVRKLKVGNTPVTTAITSDGKQLVVTLYTENAIAIVDLTTDKVEKVKVGEGPAQVYIQPDDKVTVVANQGSEENPSKTITKVDLASKEAIANIETGDGTHGVVVSQDNKWIYVTNMFDDTVSIIDNTSNKEVAELKVGEIPNGISIMP